MVGSAIRVGTHLSSYVGVFIGTVVLAPTLKNEDFMSRKEEIVTNVKELIW